MHPLSHRTPYALIYLWVLYSAHGSMWLFAGANGMKQWCGWSLHSNASLLSKKSLRILAITSAKFPGAENLPGQVILLACLPASYRKNGCRRRTLTTFVSHFI